MEQIHRRFTAEQVKVLLQGYCQGMLPRPEVEGFLGINKTRFFALLKQYRQDPQSFSIAYERATPSPCGKTQGKSIQAERLKCWQPYATQS